MNICNLFQARLSKKFKIQGIPALVIVEGKTGKLITTDGRNNVLDDPEGSKFPWFPVPLSEKLKGPLCCHTGLLDADQAAARLRGKIKAIYFSAHWVSSLFHIFFELTHWSLAKVKYF